MGRRISLKEPGILLKVILSCFILPAAGRPPSPPLHFRMLEDFTVATTANSFFDDQQAFAPLKEGWQDDPTSNYRLRSTFRANTAKDPGNVLSFSHITYVDVYLFAHSGLASGWVLNEILTGNIGKIRAMMLVNQKLFNYEQGRGVSLCEFIDESSAHLQKIYDTREKTRILQDIPVTLRLSNRQTLSFGLTMSELFTNTLKHAFMDHPDPCIRVEAKAFNDNLRQFVYGDNGIVLIGIGAADERFTMGIPLS